MEKVGMWDVGCALPPRNWLSTLCGQVGANVWRMWPSNYTLNATQRQCPLTPWLGQGRQPSECGTGETRQGCCVVPSRRPLPRKPHFHGCESQAWLLRVGRWVGGAVGTESCIPVRVQWVSVCVCVCVCVWCQSLASVAALQKRAEGKFLCRNLGRQESSSDARPALTLDVPSRITCQGLGEVRWPIDLGSKYLMWSEKGEELHGVCKRACVCVFGACILLRGRRRLIVKR